MRSIARRYRRLRVLFPDAPRDLAPKPARHLELLELAGRALTDPRLRQIYDQLRSGGGAVTNQVLRRPAATWCRGLHGNELTADAVLRELGQ